MDDRFLDHRYEIAGRVIDPILGTVARNGGESSVSRKQLEVLALLAGEQGRQVPRDDFIDQVWDGNRLTGERGLTDTIYALRRSLEDKSPKDPLIRTIPRRGYKLNATAHLLRDDEARTFSEGWEIPGRPGWHLERMLARSAEAETWLAREQRGQEQRVLRFCRNEDNLQHLRREIEVLRFLRRELADHAHVVRIIGWRLDEPPYFLEMETSEHGDLAEWSASRGGLDRIPLCQRVELIAQTASALDAVHSLGIVHRNLSPASLFIDEGADPPAARLGKLGCGASTRPSEQPGLDLSASGRTWAGYDEESAYLAPECAAGEKATTASDVYGLGVLLYQVVIGDLCRSLDGDWRDAVEEEALRGCIAACVDDRPDHRPSAGALCRRLRELETSDAEKTPPTVQASSPDRPARLSPRALVGQSIGPYHLLDVLGEGGMGTVYLAEQRDPVERRVALKLIKPGMDSELVLARFEAERQALALMDHDNVAAVYDAGYAASGQPYFVMEHVPGLGITTFCDRSKLGIRTRIELFLQVCNGIHHAHQKGLIHRDLKPSNILVKRPPGQGPSVKIIDFGVAKSLQRKLSQHTIHTRLGSFVGSPSYSSPEQLSSHSLDVDTRTDVYSLGILLYELLAGVTPYGADKLASKSPIELVKLLSRDPPSPGSRFASLDSSEKEAIARDRLQWIEGLEQQLSTDLSWIIFKCLEHDPENRYASVLELKKDLLRWLADRPIEARPTTGFYRLGKLVRRHRVAVASAALATLALLATTLFAVVGFLRAEHEADKARAAAIEAEKAAEFQVRQLQAIDPAAMAIGLRQQLREHARQPMPEPGSTRAAASERERQLDRLLHGVNFTDLARDQLQIYFFEPALRAIETDYGELPLLQARLWQAMAEALRELGELERAVEPQELALETRRSILGLEEPSTLASLRSRGKLRVSLGRLEEAETDLLEAAKGLQRLLGSDHPETLAAIDELGSFFLEKGDLDEAERHYRAALEGRRRILGDEHLDTLRSINNIGSLLWQRGALDEAEAHYQEALAGRRRVLGNESLATLESLNDMGALLWKQDKPDEAEMHYREALAGFRRALGDEHPNTQVTINNLAVLLKQRGQLEKAEGLHREALQVQRSLFGDDHPSTLRSIANLGLVLRARGQLDEAELYYREALRGRRQVLGNDHPSTLSSINNLSFLLQDLGRLDEAETHIREALDGRRRVLGEDHPSTLRSLHDLGVLLRMKGRLDAAEPLHSQALEAQRRILGDEHPDTLRSISNVGYLLQARGEPDRAESLYREALAGQRRMHGDDHADTLLTKERLARVLRQAGRTEEAPG